jgi:hypothetical protein
MVTRANLVHSGLVEEKDITGSNPASQIGRLIQQYPLVQKISGIPMETRGIV